jgi:hypothetical protein
MRPAALPVGVVARALCALAALALLYGLGAGLAQGERTQRGNLIVSLDGGLSPLALPRDRPAPVSVHLEGGLQTADGTLLPRVTRIELGLPAQGVLSTRGLPACSQRRLRNTKPAEALAACRPALVGHGRLQAHVRVPHQSPFTIDARLLAFNGHADGRRAVLLHAFAASPPTVAVLPVALRHRGGRFGTVLVANLSPALGPWPRFAHFELTLSRRYSYRGKGRSYLSASCPIPRRFTAGFFSFAQASLTLAGGRRVGTGIARSCRARGPLPK